VWHTLDQPPHPHPEGLVGWIFGSPAAVVSAFSLQPGDLAQHWQQPGPRVQVALPVQLSTKGKKVPFWMLFYRAA
jgi:hypothetical protein